MGYSFESMLFGSGFVFKKLIEVFFRIYQVFMWVLYKYFISFKEEFVEIEKCIINNGFFVVFFLGGNGVVLFVDGG